ncbi:chaperone modulator CbpM [Cochleicola gelatinilyticus]|uniref:MerR family transcriptional regulator n=1 Tax=Cochleicola gelatinilyticus TaxID=1763537 RepID=A0A167HJE3_9FLAO|nr:chaperone modulator CbpM [Cochleicola gelatinilyticus]OAB78672.1 MerR family transcriptional regulator [Cochleicola gelatinilyticus]
MSTKQLIAITPICTSYNVEVSFVATLKELGLIALTRQKEEFYIHIDEVPTVEKMIRMHRDLNINPEGIDVIFNLLERVDTMQSEMTALKNRLRLYEDDL